MPIRLPIFRADDTRPLAARVRRVVLQARSVMALPPRVRRFYLRALWRALRRRDQYSLDVVTRPDDLRVILELAGDAGCVVELGTATAWTTVALALCGPPGRRVMTFDPVVHPQREWYLGLADPDVRERITFVQAMGRTGPPTSEPVDFVFVDGSHQREDTVRTFERWSQVVRPGGTIAFHDYADPAYPGVTEAIEQLELAGTQMARVFVWRAPSG